MEITDSMAEALMRTVIKNAKILAEDPLNYDARAEILWAGSLSHNGLTGCGNAGGDFASHALEHEIGGLLMLPMEPGWLQSGKLGKICLSELPAPVPPLCRQCNGD